MDKIHVVTVNVIQMNKPEDKIILGQYYLWAINTVLELIVYVSLL